MKPWALIAGFLGLAATVFAQQGPHLAYAYPAGGRVGTTFNVTVGGQYLLSVSNAFISGPGVTVTVLDRERPMAQKEFSELRDRLRTLQEKWQNGRNGNATGTNVWTPADAKEREQLRLKILRNPPNRTVNPAMADKVVLQVSVATNAPPGDRELRLGTPLNLSQPLRFCVGTLPEYSRAAANAANPDFDKFIEKLGGKPAPTGTPRNDADLTLPVVANGQIMPGGVDRFHFHAERGHHLVMAVSARQLIPYLADAVPGWFEPVLTVFDANGKELAAAARFHLRPDPVLCFDPPRDGEYVVEVHDTIFRGREDFVYRLAIGEIPYVTAIYPLGGPLGSTTSIHLTGWNLTQTSLRHPNTAAGITTLTGEFFNAVPFAVDTLPEADARGDGETPADARAVTLPVILNGRISRPGAANVFSFTGHAGDNVVAEIMARRLDSPLDSFLRLTDAKGKTIAFNDDFEDKGSGLNTHHADSYLMQTLPADGTYFIHVTDTQGGGGPDYAYRLRLSAPQPDFALRVVPSSLSLRPGASGPLKVYAVRRDGFTNAITLTLHDSPGFSLAGGRIENGQTQAQFTVKAPLFPLERPETLVVAGVANWGGLKLSHEAVPAEDMMQAFMYRHLVPEQRLMVAVSGPSRPFMRDAFRITSATPVRLPSGGSARVRVTAPGTGFLERFNLELSSPPDGIALEEVTATPAGFELRISGDADKLKPGQAGNLICELTQKSTGAAKNKKFNPSGKRGAVATLPAIPFVITEQ